MVEPVNNLDKRIDMLKNNILDLKARLPAHSVKPAMLIELEELEDELEKLANERAGKEEFKINNK